MDPKDDGTDDFIVNLRRVLEQWLDVLPFMARLSALISEFWHECSSSGYQQMVSPEEYITRFEQLGSIFIARDTFNMCQQSCESVPYTSCRRDERLKSVPI